MPLRRGSRSGSTSSREDGLPARCRRALAAYGLPSHVVTGLPMDNLGRRTKQHKLQCGQPRGVGSLWAAAASRASGGPCPAEAPRRSSEAQGYKEGEGDKSSRSATKEQRGSGQGQAGRGASPAEAPRRSSEAQGHKDKGGRGTSPAEAPRRSSEAQGHEDKGEVGEVQPRSSKAQGPRTRVAARWCRASRPPAVICLGQAAEHGQHSVAQGSAFLCLHAHFLVTCRCPSWKDMYLTCFGRSSLNAAMTERGSKTARTERGSVSRELKNAHRSTDTAQLACH